MRQDATVIGLVGLAHASSHFGHLLLPLLFPVFMKEFGLSFAELGFLMTVFFVVSGTGQATAGFVVDRIGARPALFGAFGFFIAACLVGANANGYASLMVVAVLAGLGNCTFHPVDFTILTPVEDGGNAGSEAAGGTVSAPIARAMMQALLTQ